ncbi:CRISPR-associated protein Csm1, partial [Candidatus Termititenax persephonae]
MVNNPLNEVACAGLLHDIGKLIQRADGFTKNHSDKGVEYLNQFLDRKKFPTAVINSETVVQCVRYHHARYLRESKLPPEHIAYIVYEADNIAAGMDRREDLAQEITVVNKYEKFDKSICLHSIFNKLKEKTNEKISDAVMDYRFPLNNLREDREVYPFDAQVGTGQATRWDYKKLKATLDKHLPGVAESNSLLELLEAVTSFVPSSTNTKEVPDISLFDHSKMTAAIACCMYSYFAENNITEFKESCFNQATIDENRKQNYFLLCSFDLSGIQEFIYTIASDNALKSLRARSFYLEILLENVIDEILTALGLSRANLLYIGGGHAYLLLPNTVKAKEVLANAAERVNTWFLDKFGTALYLAAAWQECSSRDLMNPREDNGAQDRQGKNIKTRAKLTGEIFKRVSDKLSENKLHRYSAEQLQRIFKLPDTVDTRECKNCKNSVPTAEDVCSFCNSLIKLGGVLVQNTELLAKVSSDCSEPDAVPLPAYDGGTRYLQVYPWQDKISPEANARYYSINKWLEGGNLATHLWLGNYRGGQDFEDLVKDSGGIKRLGVLRADVDDLGKTFGSGFEQDAVPKYEYATISRFAVLSRYLSLFFKHYINAICSEKKMAIVYAGGD